MSRRGVKRKVRTAEFKYQALLEVEKGLRTQTKIAADLNIKESTLSTWVNNAESIKRGYYKYGPKRKTMRTSNWEEMETALAKWFSNMRDQGASMTGPVLMEKATEFAQKLGMTDFKATNGWLSRFKDRYGIAFRSSTVESAWQSKLQTLLQEYGPDRIYNADETGIFFRMLPKNTPKMKKVGYNGSRRSKDRLTVLVAANMSGSDKLPLLVIGKYSKPHCFRNVKTMPTNYTDNDKAWITPEIFANWLSEIDRQMVQQKKKIVMIVDNSTAHSVNVRKLENVKLVFLPPTTSEIQPMAQGVSQRLKMNYRKRVLVQYIPTMECQTTVKLTLLDALTMLSEAWDCILPSTISNSFRRVGLVNPVKEEITATDEDEDLDDKFLAGLAMMPNHGLLTDFIEFNENIQTCADVSEENIISEVIDSRKSQTVEPESEDEDDAEVPDTDTPESNVPTSDEALEHIRKLQGYFHSKQKTDTELTVLRLLANRVLRDRITDLGISIEIEYATSDSECEGD